MRTVRPCPVITLPVESKALRNNRLRDPWRRELPVILPPGYDERSSRRYPVLWLLAGFFGTGRMALNRNYSAPALDERLARLVASGAMPPAIVALPDCMTALGGSQYMNSPGTGAYETHLCEELVPLVDRTFRTLPKKESRAVLGKSSGGYGALRLAMRRPDLFGAAASHSGDCYFEYCHIHDFPVAVNAIRAAGSVKKFVAKMRANEKPSHDDMLAMITVAMASCYSPRARAGAGSLGFDLPFDERSGEIRAGVMDRWYANDPARMVLDPKYAAALRGLRMLFLDCGTRDQWALHLGLRVLAGRLRAARVPFVHEEFNDDHMSISYRYDRSFPRITKSLERT